jgi:1-phosphatidylinositol phosphodiesterase
MKINSENCYRAESGTERALRFFDEKQLVVTDNTSEPQVFSYKFSESDGSLTISSDEKSGKYLLEFSGDSLAIVSTDTDILGLAGKWVTFTSSDTPSRPPECVVPMDEQFLGKITAASKDDSSLAIGTDWPTFRKQWISSLSNREIKDMAIPGTHDSAAYQNSGGYVLTQSRSFSQQLDDGIRFFDLRLSENLNFFHGKFYLGLSFGDFMNAVDGFFRQHPREMIIASIKTENCDDNKKFYDRLTKEYVENSRWKNMFYTGTYLPSLDEVRGKIVIIRRFDTLGYPGYGINAWSYWKDDDTFVFPDTKGLLIQVQDRYKCGSLFVNRPKNKVGYINSDLDNARDRQKPAYITFFSIQADIAFIETLANRVQDYLNDGKRFPNEICQRHFNGIYPMDYYWQYFVDCFIYTNWR